MPKVIVERPRWGSRARLKNRVRVDDDEMLPTKLGVKRDAMLRSGWTKSLNENLTPLRRYLEAQVGRPWDKVWSEICKNLKPLNTVQQHVRDHIPDFVAIKTSLKDGEVWVLDRWSGGPLKDSHMKLFVDPKSGLLRRNKHWRSWAAKRKAATAKEAQAAEKRRRIVSKTKQYHLLDDGGWWEVTLAAAHSGMAEFPAAPRAQTTTSQGAVDVVQDAGLSELGRSALYGRSGVYAVAKRQLSKKEMRDLGLRSRQA